MFNKALERKRREGIPSLFDEVSSISPPTHRENDMHATIQNVSLMSQFLYYVSDEEFRSFSKRVNAFSKRYCKEILFKLTELVEREITREMRGTRGAIVHDA